DLFEVIMEGFGALAHRLIVLFINQGFGHAEHVRERVVVVLQLLGVVANHRGELMTLLHSRFGAEVTIGAAFGDSRRQWTVPDVAVTHGIAVILQFQRASLGKWTGFGTTHMTGAAFEPGMVLDQYAVLEHSHVSRIHNLAFLVDWA